jgi:hypothetical protein
VADWAIVIPSNRPDRLTEWRADWEPRLKLWGHDVQVYVVEDAPPWPGIPDWVPKRTDMIRSWGFYLAWRDGHRRILSMDDDVRVRPVSWHGHHADPLAAYDEGFRIRWPVSSCLSVGALTNTGLQMRGFPTEGRGHRAAIQYGGWDGVPDLDGETQLTYPDTRSYFEPVVMPVPKGCAVTTCAMNFAFERDYTPWCWQLPVCEEGPRRYDRWGDIWSGLVQKRLCDLHEVAMLVNGRATVRHERASDPRVNAAKELPGRGPHEGLWEAICDGAGDEPFDVFSALIDHVGDLDSEWHDHAMRCLDSWLELFEVQP